MKPRENIIKESQPAYGFINLSEEEKMWQEFNRPFIDKIQSFTRMLRRNKMLDKVIIHPKK